MNDLEDRARDHDVPAPRGRPRLQLRLRALHDPGVARPLRPVPPALPRRLPPGPVLAAVRAAHRRLVRAEAPRRGLRRDVRRVADAALASGASGTRAGARWQAAVRRPDGAPASRDASPCVRRAHTDITVEEMETTVEDFYKKAHRGGERSRWSSRSTPTSSTSSPSRSAGRRASRPAADLLKENRKALIDKVTYWTGVQRPLVQAARRVDRGARAASSELRADVRSEKEHLTEVTAYATALAMNYLTRGKFVQP